MIRINGFLHRNQFMNLMRRWFYNQLEPADLSTIKAIINFNSVWIGRVGRDFGEWLITSYTGKPFHEEAVTNKGRLKDLLVENPVYTNERINTLIRRYKEHPERYLRETPFSGILYWTEENGSPVYLGSRRVKRVRRIAEKGARRISDYIFRMIREQADSFAQIRADVQGIPKEELITPPEQMIDEFELAESHIAMKLSRGELFGEDLEFVLEDVLGMKIIADDEERQTIIDLIDANPRCQIKEVEEHTGRYNAVNVVINYRPDRDKLLDRPLSKEALERFASRGMNPENVYDDLRQFVLSGEDSITIELIISNFEEMLESEIGRSMHEDRIIEQRHKQIYRGYLARNVSYLMEYIFACGISPKTHIDEIPIKTWGRYMPDFFDEILKDLFNIPTFREIE